MLKLNYGSIRSDEAGGKKIPLDVPILTNKNLTTLLIGGGVMAAGMLYIWFWSFKNGADSYDTTEWLILDDLKLTKETQSTKLAKTN